MFRKQRMRLVDHLVCVLILDDAEVSTKKQAFEAILESLAARGCFSATLVPELLAAIINRDELGPTGIGEGVAIPHAWHAGLDRMIVALAISRQGVDYGSIDGEPVHILLLILTEPMPRPSPPSSRPSRAGFIIFGTRRFAPTCVWQARRISCGRSFAARINRRQSGERQTGRDRRQRSCTRDCFAGSLPGRRCTGRLGAF